MFTCMLLALTIQIILIYIFSLIAIYADPVKKLHPARKELQHGGHIPLHLPQLSQSIHGKKIQSVFDNQLWFRLKVKCTILA